ncbi:hypothetical protein MMC28_003672 [Mycoblastus sanguinarius]|nr:hypothetical protein [Mycoblastus sanguinarius]
MQLQVFSSVIFAGSTLAQFSAIQNLPTCGQNSFNDVFNQTSINLHCPQDLVCTCSKADLGSDVMEASAQACPKDTDTTSIAIVVDSLCSETIGLAGSAMTFSAAKSLAMPSSPNLALMTSSATPTSTSLNLRARSAPPDLDLGLNIGVPIGVVSLALAGFLAYRYWRHKKRPLLRSHPSAMVSELTPAHGERKKELGSQNIDDMTICNAEDNNDLQEPKEKKAH